MNYKIGFSEMNHNFLSDQTIFQKIAEHPGDTTYVLGTKTCHREGHRC